MIKVFTDGACSGNPGDGGWGVYTLDDNGQENEWSGFEHNTTNNRMELRAAIEALTHIPVGANIALHTDSQYVQLGITTWIKAWHKNDWRTASKQPVKNKDLWVELDRLLANHQVTWHWVKGHNGNLGNERADVLARNAIVQACFKRTH